MQRKNWRRACLYAAAATAALLVSGPMLPIELAIWFSGELLLYLEVVSGVWLASRTTGWTALRRWLGAKAGRLRHRILVEWPTSRPASTSWLHWTFATA